MPQIRTREGTHPITPTERHTDVPPPSHTFTLYTHSRARMHVPCSVTSAHTGKHAPQHARAHTGSYAPSPSRAMPRLTPRTMKFPATRIIPPMSQEETPNTFDNCSYLNHNKKAQTSTFTKIPTISARIRYTIILFFYYFICLDL